MYVTGGSTGLGKALALALVRLGADVTIVARNPERLAAAIAELKAAVKPEQKIYSVSADLTDAQGSQDALDAAVKLNGKCPDYAFLCAGASFPRYFIDTTPEQLREGMDYSYWIQAWSAHALSRAMVAKRVKGSIVLVSSFLGYTSFVGYTNYSPGKYALRGLADSLRSEMLLHDINIHLFMPAGIDSPGYVTEQLHKPAPTRKLEEGDKVISPEECAQYLIRGMQKGHYQPSSYFITDLMRAASKGGVPRNNVVVDSFYWLLSGVG